MPSFTFVEPFAPPPMVVFNPGSFISKAIAGKPLGLSDAEVDSILHFPILGKIAATLLNAVDPLWATPVTKFGDLPDFAMLNGKFPNGSGGSTHDFVSQTHDNLYMGIDVIHRQGNDYTPLSIDNHGVAHYQVLAGPQVINPSYGVFAANANRYEWSFNFDIASKNTGETLKQVLGHESIDLIIRVNGVQQTNLHGAWDTAHQQFVFVDPAHPTGAITDNTGNAFITSNSQNLKFASVNPAGLNIHAGDHIDIVLVGTDIATHTILQNTHVALDVVDHLPTVPPAFHDYQLHA